MSKVKHTKNELKKQKDALKRYERYLPTLFLKKQQLQLEILKISHKCDDIAEKIDEKTNAIYKWVEVFQEDEHLKGLVKIDKVEALEGNIAGIDIPVFKTIHFIEKPYDFLSMPIWVDFALKAIKEMLSLKAELIILKQQLDLVKNELRVTTQRVNLFEKVKIPEARDNIRNIQIFLGDLQTAQVVTGKIAKKQIEQKNEKQAVSP